MTNMPHPQDASSFNPSNVSPGNPSDTTNNLPVNPENTEIVQFNQDQNGAFRNLQNMPPQNGENPPPIVDPNNGQNAPNNVQNGQDDQPKKKPIKKSTIMGASLMITNICLGTTIFTFAVRAKYYGLVWLLVFCFIVAAINYWSITRCVNASSKSGKDDFSEITEHFMGKKGRLVLNIFLIVYSYATLTCFVGLIYPLFGRFIQSAFYRKKYVDYEHFEDEKWGKMYIKIPFFVGLAAVIGTLCLIRDINKLNFSAYIGVASCAYAIIVVMVQCHSYYEHYKDTVYKEDDPSTHVNWIDFGDAFTSELVFFKGFANLLFAYACQSGIFPIHAGFKMQKDGDKKMKISSALGMLFTTILHIISIVCGFLTDPITPEDLIIYRKNKGSGKDVAMVIARLLVVISLIFTVPGYYFPLRLSVINSFTGGQLTTRFNIIFTYVSVFACAAIASIYDKILNYLSYIGFISVFISFLFPILLNIKASGKKFTYWKNMLDFILAIIICAFALVAFVATLRDDIKG